MEGGEGQAKCINLKKSLQASVPTWFPAMSSRMYVGALPLLLLLLYLLLLLLVLLLVLFLLCSVTVKLKEAEVVQQRSDRRRNTPRSGREWEAERTRDTREKSTHPNRENNKSPDRTHRAQQCIRVFLNSLVRAPPSLPGRSPSKQAICHQDHRILARTQG